MDPGKVQGALDQVEREIAVLVQGVPGEASPLRLAWSRLVAVLALEPPRAMRDCPRCGQPGMREATLCGYCWLKLVAPESASAIAGANS
jgi:hypothetical protein